MAKSFEFTIEGRAYKARRLDPFAQFDMLAKVSPLMAAGFGEFLAFIVHMRQEGLANLEDAPLDKMAGILAPIARELAKMSDSDRREVIGACLGQCERQSENRLGWEKIWNQAAGRAMFEDINDDALLMLKISYEVFKGNFARFFPASLSNLLGGAAA